MQYNSTFLINFLGKLPTGYIEPRFSSPQQKQTPVLWYPPQFLCDNDNGYHLFSTYHVPETMLNASHAQFILIVTYRGDKLREAN